MSVPLLPVHDYGCHLSFSACMFRYNGLSLVYLIYLLLIPLFADPTRTTMQGKKAAPPWPLLSLLGSGFQLLYVVSFAHTHYSNVQRQCCKLAWYLKH